MVLETKPKYSIRNWSQYNRSLVQRGSITVWFSNDAVDKWFAKDSSGRGRPRYYSDDAILCALLIRTVYHQPLRATEGFLHSLIELLKLPLKSPSYTQICRRAVTLGKTLKKLSSRRPTDIVFDSTGLKVYGEGEWKVRKHGASKRRTWMKLHIGMDPDSGEIIVGELTGNGTGSSDGETAKKLLKTLPKEIQRVFGDGAYDDTKFRQEVAAIGAKSCVPPPRDAVIHDSVDPAMTQRNDAIRAIMGLGGDDEARKMWKILEGYHTRSLAETSMYRLKQITGSMLRSRKQEQQRTEAIVKCMVINKMTKLGMPQGNWS